jgi:hypothetical protein
MKSDEIPVVSAPFPAWRVLIGIATVTMVTIAGLTFGTLWNAGWFGQIPREFEPYDLGCRVMMPGPVNETKMFQASQDVMGEYCVRRNYPWESFGIAAQDIDLKKLKSRKDRTQLLDKSLKDFLPPATEPPQFVDAVVSSYTARETIVVHPKHGRIIARTILVGSRVFILVAAGKKITPDRADVAKFFGSFEVVEEDLLDDERKEVKRALK